MTTDREKAVERVVSAARQLRHERETNTLVFYNERRPFLLDAIVDAVRALDALPPPIAAPVPLTEERVREIAFEIVAMQAAQERPIYQDFDKRIAALESKPAPAATNPLVIEECRYCGRDVRHGLHSEKQCNNPKPAAPEPAKAACPICGRVDGPLEGHIHTSPANVSWPAAPPPKETGEGMTHEEWWIAHRTVSYAGCTPQDYGNEWMQKRDFLKAAPEVAAQARRQAFEAAEKDFLRRCWHESARAIRALAAEETGGGG